MSELILNSPIDILLLLTGAVVFIVFFYAVLISIKENEPNAAIKFLVVGLLLPMPYFLSAVFIFPGREIVAMVLLFLPVAGLLLFLLPYGKNRAYREVVPVHRVDERDTMFSRNELISGTQRYDKYYTLRPEKREIDNRFRQNPGLLNKETTQYHPWYFASAEASFETIAALRNEVDGTVRDEKIPVKAEEISRYIKNWAKKLGAVDCGMTQLKEYSIYSVGGRADRYGEIFSKKHFYAIAFTVEMEHEMVLGAPSGSMVMESGQQYLESGRIALQVARFIRNLGYEASAHIDGNYKVICPLVARDAGLGEIGRMGLLMTPKLGPRVRIAVVSTNMPLVTDKPLHDYSFIDFCVQCKKCAEVCPSQAISFDNRKIIDGSLRWQINQESCFTYWTKAGTDCGRCISVCPFSHPDNALHGLVRAGIRNSSLFRTLALKLDNAFYGRKPIPGRLPDWMT